MHNEVIIADYTNPQHAQDIVYLLDYYATDVAGGGRPLPDDVKSNIVGELSKRSSAFSVLYYQDGQASGLANCFEGFSTFSCKPLINIHDVVVIKRLRGKGISRLLLEAIEEEAKERGCCKITLEVLENNCAATNAYGNFGFRSYSLDPSMGRALFWEKHIDAR